MFPPPHSKPVDMEGGNGALYPSMQESPALRWAFIRKVYVILSIQLLMTVGVAAVVVFVHPISHFFVSSLAGLVVYILIIILAVITMIGVFYLHQRHPVNFLLLALFTVLMSFSVGLACAFTKGEVVLEAAILTAVVAVGLTLYTFWAARRGQDFSFLGPFLFAGLLVLMVFSLLQFVFHMGKITVMIYGVLAALIFSGYIIYDTDNLIKRFSYDEYILASISLYLDVINLFLALLDVFRALD